MNNDLISREALKEEIRNNKKVAGRFIEGVIMLIDNAPTVEERPQGEWKDESRDSLLCTCCNKRVYKPFIGGFPTERSQHYYPNFCAFCGADMRKGDAEK